MRSFSICAYSIAKIMPRVITVYLIKIIATISSIAVISCQELPIAYNVTVTTACSATRNQMNSIKRDIRVLLKNSVLPGLNHTENTGPGYGACGCGGPGWKRAGYLDMFDPTQTCPPAWELISTPRRSCGRPSSAVGCTCDSAAFPIQKLINIMLKSVDELKHTRLDNQEHFILKMLVILKLLMVHMSME